MKRRNLYSLFAALLLTVLATTATAAAVNGDEDDTDTRFVNAKVVEVTDGHISVIARSGVEHVIGIDEADTRVKIEGKLVSLKDVRQGDVVTVELDEASQVKFARHITVSVQADSQLARTRP